MNPEHLHSPVRLVTLVAALVAFLALASCASSPGPRYTSFAMEGPPLVIVGGSLFAPGPDSGSAVSAAAPVVAADLPLHGGLERSGMVGNGEIWLEYKPTGVICRGRLKDGPAPNGRIRGIIPCVFQGGQGRPEPEASPGTVFMLLTLSQQGPDQGLGLAQFASPSDPHAPPGQAEGAEKEAAATDAETVDIQDLHISEAPPLLFFYHPWDEEAARRYLDARETLQHNLMEKKKNKLD